MKNLILTLVMGLSLVACSGSDSDDLDATKAALKRVTINLNDIEGLNEEQSLDRGQFVARFQQAERTYLDIQPGMQYTIEELSTDLKSDGSNEWHCKYEIEIKNTVLEVNVNTFKMLSEYTLKSYSGDDRCAPDKREQKRVQDFYMPKWSKLNYHTIDKGTNDDLIQLVYASYEGKQVIAAQFDSSDEIPTQNGNLKVTGTGVVVFDFDRPFINHIVSVVDKTVQTNGQLYEEVNIKMSEIEFVNLDDVSTDGAEVADKVKEWEF